MKRQIAMAVYLLLVTGANHICKAQTIPVPEYQHKIMAVSSDNTLVPLEKTKMVLATNNKGFFQTMGNAYSGKGKAYYSADGCCSQVHRSGKTSNRYIVSIPAVNPNVEDPDYGIQLFTFEELKKNERRFHFTDETGSLFHKSKHEDFSIQLIFTKQSDGVYIITTKDPLPPGEYIFVDWKDPNSRKWASPSSVDSHSYLTGFCFSVQ